MFGKVEELVILLIIVLVLFGGKKLPEFSRGIAESIKEVRKGFRDDPQPRQSESNNSQTKA